MSMNTVPERLAALRAAMAANGVAVYLIPVGDPHASEYLPCHYTSLTWFSGFHGENSNFVVTRTESALWADGRYFVQAEKEIAGTEIKLQRMGEPGVPTVEEYCANALNEGEALGLCGLTASTALVNDLKKALEKKGASIKTLNLEDELWTEGRPALPDTPAWILPKEYAGFSPAEKLDQLRSKLKELGCTAQFVGKLDNLAWLLNLRAMDIECTPYAMAYCYVTPSRAVLFINTARVTPEAKAELEANGITLAEYDDVLKFLAAETEPQTVLAECATVNHRPARVSPAPHPEVYRLLQHQLFLPAHCGGARKRALLPRGLCKAGGDAHHCEHRADARVGYAQEGRKGRISNKELPDIRPGVLLFPLTSALYLLPGSCPSSTAHRR